MGKPMYNFGKTANLKAQQKKQMDRDLRRRIARQSKANTISRAHRTKTQLLPESKLDGRYKRCFDSMSILEMES